jgi:hypothetical protein
MDGLVEPPTFRFFRRISRCARVDHRTLTRPYDLLVRFRIHGQRLFDPKSSRGADCQCSRTPTWARSFANVHWRPLLVVAIVAHMITHFRVSRMPVGCRHA